ncbi:MAG: thioredoxin domain-containing protein [Bdellovibrionales bacterium]|nr:thioredoxin domain-containing protein [Bdellovibrionales bacterium]
MFEQFYIKKEFLLKKSSLLWGALAVLVVTGCTSKSQLEKTLADNPDIVFDVIKKNPKKFVEVVNEAVRTAQETSREDDAKEEQARLEEEIKNPKTPVIEEGRVIFGKKDAPITIVEYSDFQCPYCSRGYNTIKEVHKMYGDKVRVVFKHLPLDFHPMAMPAARYFEAIAIQDHGKAEKFHDEIFTNQTKLNQEGEKFLKAAAKKVGANLAKLEKDIASEGVQKRIAADMEEAKKFEFSGTPGFLINGVSLRGAYPAPEFKKIIDRQMASAGSAGDKKAE